MHSTSSEKPANTTTVRRFGCTVCLALAALTAAGADWCWPPAWHYRQPVTISHTLADAPLTNFPVLVQITSADNPVFAKAKPGGIDIIFTAADGITRLAAEIETFDASPGGEQLLAWVKIPSLSSSQSTLLYMYYGGDFDTFPQDHGLVWSESFNGVWHLSEEAAGTNNAGVYRDSSASAYHGVDNVAATGKAGKIGKGQEFVRADADHIKPGCLMNYATNFTVEAWIKNRAGNAWQVAVGPNGSYPGLITDHGLNLERGMFSYQRTDNSYAYLYYTFPGVTGTDPITEWTHVATRRDGDTLQVYANGALVRTATGVNAAKHGNLLLYISSPGSTRAWDGYVDEVRVSSVARSAEWIQAGYRTGLSPESYIATGAQETIPPGLSWYNRKWTHRQWIVMPAGLTDTTLYDFPILVQATNANNGVFTSAQEDGSDICFVSGESAPVVLSHEIERFATTPGNPELTAWVRIPQLTATNDTIICMYYGNPRATDQQDTTNVWDAHFDGVWHLDEDAAGTGSPDVYRDSTSNAFHGTDYTASTDKTGKVGRGQGFVKTNLDYILTTCPLAYNAPFTVEAWIRENTTSWQAFMGAVGTYPGLICDRGLATQRGWLGYTDTNDIAVTTVEVGYSLGVDGTAPATNWTHVVVSRAGNNLHAYVNGAWTKTLDVSTAKHTNLGALRLSKPSTTTAVDGNMDEVRVSTVTRSPDWIRATYRITSLPEAWLTLSAEQTVPDDGSLIMIR